ncbi:MAG TPA: sigma-70 family RNA polymerase sigma factor [Oligoflexia bacterium]|nr:sigma-70 family RNA polymerase sigma factor [Oligoflexia bacterium]
MNEALETRAVIEKRIIRRVLAGDKDEFRLLVLAYQERVFAVIVRMVGSENTAKELTQEAFIKAYLNLEQFRFESSFSTWLTRIALNVGNSYFSSRAFKEQSRTTSLDEMNYREIPAPGKTEAYDEEALARLRFVAGKLRPKLRDVFVLCSLDGRSYEETARILGIPVGTVRSRLNKARLQMRQMYFEA